MLPKICRRLRQTIVATAFLNAVAVYSNVGLAAQTVVKTVGKSKPEATNAHLETYKDLIIKAHNLTLQHDRLQASQILIRAIQREPKNTLASRELMRALDELANVFYTDKAQTLFVAAESQVDEKPREAIEQYQEALRVEDSNGAVLKSQARTYLRLFDCDKADAALKSLEALNPFSAETKLLRLQVWDCQKNLEPLAAVLATKDPELEPVEKFLRSLQMKDFFRRKDFKKARSLLTLWEIQMPEYPEVQYWKWLLSEQPQSQALSTPDRVAALKYTQQCQNLSPRRKKSYNFDVDLCKGKDAVDEFLKSSGFQHSAPIREDHHE